MAPWPLTQTHQTQPSGRPGEGLQQLQSDAPQVLTRTFDKTLAARAARCPSLCISHIAIHSFSSSTSAVRHFNILETYCSPLCKSRWGEKRCYMIKCMASSLTRKLKKKIDLFKSHGCQVGFGWTFPGYITCFYVLMQHSATGKNQKEGEALCSHCADGAACCASVQNYKRAWKYSNLATGQPNMFPLWENGQISNCEFELRENPTFSNAQILLFIYLHQQVASSQTSFQQTHAQTDSCL